MPTSNPELERWNGRFAAPEYIFGTAPNGFLASQKNLLRPGQRALCVADGEGRNSVWLAEQGLAVTAFDVVAAIFVQFADPAMRRFLFERMMRSLAQGGWVLLIGYTPKQHQYKTGGPKQVENLYTEPMLRGPSALIDLVAKKPL